MKMSSPEELEVVNKRGRKPIHVEQEIILDSNNADLKQEDAICIILKEFNKNSGNEAKNYTINENFYVCDGKTEYIVNEDVISVLKSAQIQFRYVK